MTVMRSPRGYSMFELLLTLTVVSILAAVAYPSLMRARSASIEASTVTSMRAIVSAQAVYASSCGSGFYSPSVTWLTRPNAAGRDAFLGPEFHANVVDRLGYRIRFTPGAVASTAPKTCNGLAAGQTLRDYFVAASPAQATGAAALGRYFGVNASGSVFVSVRRVRPVFTGTPSAPAKPL
jgi:prepilin-type N-terminal cleavage/methylation domain-containing protein